MTSLPLVSIIIPCYNSATYVGDAIQSGIGQTYRNCEVIVIDDGSTDGSLDVIRSFGDAIRWETGPNRGAAAARNRGIELARGELVQFLDSDDLLHSEKLDRQVPLVVAKVADIVFCDRETYPIAHPEQARIESTGYGEGEDAIVLCAGRFLQIHTSLHWRSVLKSFHGFREDLRNWEDYELYLRLACAGLSFHRMPEALCVRRRVADSLSSGSLPQALDVHDGILWQAYNQLAQADKLTDERARAFGECMATDARLYMKFGQYDKARDYFTYALKMHPGSLLGAHAAFPRTKGFLLRVFGPIVTERLAVLYRTLRTR